MTSYQQNLTLNFQSITFNYWQMNFTFMCILTESSFEFRISILKKMKDNHNPSYIYSTCINILNHNKTCKEKKKNYKSTIKKKVCKYIINKERTMRKENAIKDRKRRIRIKKHCVTMRQLLLYLCIRRNPPSNNNNRSFTKDSLWSATSSMNCIATCICESFFSSRFFTSHSLIFFFLFLSYPIPQLTQEGKNKINLFNKAMWMVRRWN